MGDVTRPGCFATSEAAAAAGAMAGAPAGTPTIGAATTVPPRPTRTRRPARSISISVRPVSSSSLASSRMSSLSIPLPLSAIVSSLDAMSALALAGKSGEAVDRKRIACDAEAADHGLGGKRHIGVVTPRLAGVDVADMGLDHRHLD